MFHGQNLSDEKEIPTYLQHISFVLIQLAIYLYWKGWIRLISLDPAALFSLQYLQTKLQKLYY